MAHETVPADIAAAIEAFGRARAMLSSATACGSELTKFHASEGLSRARASLDAAILHHLRAYDEMKAALEAQTSGGA